MADNPSYPPSNTTELLLVVHGCLMRSLVMKTAPAGQGYLPRLPLRLGSCSEALAFGPGVC